LIKRKCQRGWLNLSSHQPPPHLERVVRPLNWSLGGMLGPPSKAGKGVDRPFPFLFFLEKKRGCNGDFTWFMFGIWILMENMTSRYLSFNFATLLRIWRKQLLKHFLHNLSWKKLFP
jgi:hypothetical protein